MRRIFAVALAASALGLGNAQAQVKFAEFAPDSAPTATPANYQPAKRLADLKHGTMLALNLTNGKTVKGNVVRFDAKNNKLYVRTRAGEAPVAYGENDIKSMNVAVRQVSNQIPVGAQDEWWTIPGGLQENASGVVRIPPRGGAITPAALTKQPETKIKPAIDQTAALQNVVQAEIVKQVVTNGTQRTVSYYSNVVSPAEREMLDQLAKAENQVLALEGQRDLRDSVINQEVAMNELRLRQQQLINQAIRNEMLNYNPYPLADRVYAGSVLVPNVGYLPQGTYGAYNAYNAYANDVYATSRGVNVQLPPVALPATSLAVTVAPVDPQAYAAARAQLESLLRNVAILEDGRLVAVTASGSMSSAPQ